MSSVRTPLVLLVFWLTFSLLLLGGCMGRSTPPTKVILLPQLDGSASAVVVQEATQQEQAAQVLDTPYQVAGIRPSQLPAVAQSDAGQVAAEYGWVLNFKPPIVRQRFTLSFIAGGNQLTPESAALLPAILTRARANAVVEIIITGYTDTNGDAAANDALSLNRAQTVRELFIAQAFPANRIEAIGRGEREPAIATADGVDEPANRRVVIELRE